MSKITITKNGRTKQIKKGFSWTVFFFGFIALGIRNQWWAVLLSFLSWGLANFYYMFKANHHLLEQYLGDGWEIVPEVPVARVVPRIKL